MMILFQIISVGKNSIRFSKRKRPENYSIRSASRSEADEILRNGDAVRLTWKNVSVTTVPEVGLLTKLGCRKTAKAAIGKPILQNSEYCCWYQFNLIRTLCKNTHCLFIIIYLPFIKPSIINQTLPTFN